MAEEQVAPVGPPRHFTERYIGTTPILTKKCAIGELSPDKKTELNKLFYNDYVFNSHIPSTLFDKIGIERPKNDTEYDEALKKICADPRVVKFVNIHGWSAGKEIWEVGDEKQKIPTWTDRQLQADVKDDRKQTDVLGSIVINLDSNGWGESTITNEGMALLPSYFNYLVGIHHDKPTGKRKSDHNQYMAAMPGSVAHAAKAMNITLDQTLGMKGTVLLTGHSQGGQITRSYIAQDRNVNTSSSDKTALGFCIEAAEMGNDLLSLPNYQENTGGLFDKLLVSVGITPEERPSEKSTQLSRIVNNARNSVVRLVNDLKPAVVNVLSRSSTMDAAMNDLPLEVKTISEAIAKLHGGEIERKQLLTLVQAYAWQEFVQETPEVLTKQIRGNSDKLTPNEPFEVWYNSFSVKLDLIPGTRLFSMNELPPAEYIPGPHYAHLVPQNAEKLILNEVQSVKDFQYNASILDKAEVLMKTYKNKLRFSLSSEKEVLKPFHERVEEVEQILKKASEKALPFPVVIPITLAERTSLYARLAKQSESIKYTTPLVEKLSSSMRIIDHAQKDNFGLVRKRYSSFATIADTFPFYLYLEKPIEEVKKSFIEWMGFKHRLGKTKNYSSDYGKATLPGRQEYPLEALVTVAGTKMHDWEELVAVAMKFFSDGKEEYVTIKQ